MKTDAGLHWDADDATLARATLDALRWDVVVPDLRMGSASGGVLRLQSAVRAGDQPRARSHRSIPGPGPPKAP